MLKMPMRWAKGDMTTVNTECDSACEEARMVEELKVHGIPAYMETIGGYPFGNALTPNGYQIEFRFGVMDEFNWTVWAHSADDSEDTIPWVYLETVDRGEVIRHILYVWRALCELPAKTANAV